MTGVSVGQGHCPGLRISEATGWILQLGRSAGWVSQVGRGAGWAPSLGGAVGWAPWLSRAMAGLCNQMGHRLGSVIRWSCCLLCNCLARGYRLCSQARQWHWLDCDWMGHRLGSIIIPGWMGPQAECDSSAGLLACLSAQLGPRAGWEPQTELLAMLHNQMGSLAWHHRWAELLAGLSGHVKSQVRRWCLPQDLSTGLRESHPLLCS